MQPSSGGFWQPGNTNDAASEEQPEAQSTITPKRSVSAYSGYELTEPEQKPAPAPVVAEVEWEASEYIQHDKDAGWFIILGTVAIIIFSIALMFRQWTFAALVIAMTVAIIVYARRPPRILHYKLGLQNFSIENKDYYYKDFKAFGVTRDGPLHMITFLPRKRFSPPVSMYFDEEDGEQIVDILAGHMPMQPLKHDLFDEFVRKLRF